MTVVPMMLHLNTQELLMDGVRRLDEGEHAIANDLLEHGHQPAVGRRGDRSSAGTKR